MSGYTTAATLIADAMHQAYQQGTNLDEMFAVLSVQREVTSVHLAQAALHQQAVLAKQAQDQADKAALEEDLKDGADSWMTFRRITLPGMRTALLSGGLLAFALSFDEVIVTLFAAGPGARTLPVWVYSEFQRSYQLPVVNVVALLLVLVSVVPVWIAQRIGGGEITRGGR